MKRTQLYLDDDVWEALRLRSRQAGTSVSDLVRRAVREKYASSLAYRSDAMKALAGIWKNRRDFRDTESYVRRLRRGSRLKRIF